MPDDGTRLAQRRLAPNLFEVRYRERVFLVRAYPIRIIELDGNPSPAEVAPDLARRLMGDDTDCLGPVQFRGFGAVEFVATTRCNLRCTHCTARAFDKVDDGFYYGLPAADMPRKTMIQAIENGIAQLEVRLQQDPVTTPVFEMFITGGEPLLVWDDLRVALDFARRRLAQIRGIGSFVFTPHIVTNGLLIDEALAGELTRSQTVVTVALDSPYNQARIDAQGRPATPRAIRGLRNLVDSGHTQASVNVVIAGEDLHRIDDVFAYLADLGAFQGITTIQLSPLAPPIHHTEFAGKGRSTRLSGFRDATVCAAFSEKLIEYSDRYDIDMKLYATKLGAWLDQGGTLYRCPVAEWKWCAAPNGDVYACHQLVGIERFKMGNLTDYEWYDSPAARKIRDSFLERTVFKADRCAECVLCSTCMVFVDCPARSFLEEGDIFTVASHYCDSGKTYLEKLFGEHIISLIERGHPAKRPLCPS